LRCRGAERNRGGWRGQHEDAVERPAQPRGLGDLLRLTRRREQAENGSTEGKKEATSTQGMASSPDKPTKTGKKADAELTENDLKTAWGSIYLSDLDRSMFFVDAVYTMERRLR
jgi:hypothetical protein